jgi:hypothetical protein
MYYRDLLFEEAKSGNAGDANSARLCSGRFVPRLKTGAFTDAIPIEAIQIVKPLQPHLRRVIGCLGSQQPIGDNEHLAHDYHHGIALFHAMSDQSLKLCSKC